MHLLISPSYGKAASRKHWADTVEQPVPFVDSHYARTLTDEQHSRLLAVHPEGRARFWGAVPSHDKKMRDVVPGDVVLFTGGNRVRAVAEIGVIFRNRELADLLWPPPDESAPSWHTVYTLLDLTDTDIPYRDLNAALGYEPTYVFPGQRVFPDDRARTVLEELMIASSVEQVRAVGPAQRPDPASRAAVRMAAAEQNRTFGTAYERTGRLIVVDRKEARLVAAYKDHLAATGRKDAGRFFCPSGVSDLYLSDDEGTEVIEAKSAASHQYVRQALAQLLDYAPHSPRRPDRLSGLFPAPVAHDDLLLLHRYGIDCIQREESGVFVRAAAPAERRALMRSVWSG
ncbi:hypothetical protein [Streptomyces rimosus]|uniref:hypothetical protein n=1 Tax=Streptomyces rimosus TaxID=1927 RepID=UPI000AB5D695|nr:hypothetical protein [Streptomyces rimosus]